MIDRYITKLLVSAGALAACCSAFAAGRELTYVDPADRMVGYSTWRAETVDLAMHADNPYLAGLQVTGMRVKVNSDQQAMSGFSLWLSESLNLEKNESGKKVNVPDIISVAATPDADGWLSVKFEKPYELTSKGVYAGYSFTIDEYDDDKGQPIAYSQTRHEGGFFFHGTKSAVKWVDYEDRLKGVLPIYLTLDGDFDQCSLGLEGWATDYPLAQRGSSFSLPVNVWNLSENAVTSVDYTYSADGYAGSGHLDLIDPVEADLANSSKLRLPFEPMDATGVRSLTLRIEKVNGVENPSAYAECVLPLECRELVPVRRAVIEEATGTWCSACPRGIKAFEALGSIYGDSFIGIAYHGGNDPMAGNWSFPFDVPHFPSATLNRGDVIDPYFGTDNTQTQHFAIRRLVEECVSAPALAAIDAKAHWIEETGMKIDVEASIAFVDNQNGSDFKMDFILMGNGLSGKGEFWSQSNSYAERSAEELGPVLAPLGELGHKIEGMMYNEVVLLAEEGEGMLSGNITANTPVAVKHSFDGNEAVSAFALTAGESLIQDRSKLEAVVLLLGKDGRVVNAAKAHVEDSSGVAAVIADGDARVISSEVYDFAGRRLNGAEGLCIRVDRLSDGGRRVAKCHR